MNTSQQPRSARAIRESLDHPVIDADGHFVEFGPALAAFLEEEGADPRETYRGATYSGGTPRIERLAPEERDQGRAVRGPWWPFPAENARDIATAMLPELLCERLPELGIDFAILYPSRGLVFPHIPDESTRRRACRAMNRYSAEIFAPLADRMTPAAVIPLHTPEEGIEALEHAVCELRLKTAVIPSYVERPVPGSEKRVHNVWFDSFGLDSAHDYDPFWRRAVELGVSLGSHSATMGIGFRRSPSSYVYNHIGHFAAAGEALAKSLLLGGVTRCVSGLRLALLEGGVHWAVALLGDLISHWEKRNFEAVQIYDPAKINLAEIQRLVANYGTRLTARGSSTLSAANFAGPGPYDDFEQVGVANVEELAERFLPNFSFGCEADDPMTATAFDTARTPLGRPLRALFSSDIGHWDVPDMRVVLVDAFEPVERGWLTRDAFRDFTCANAVRFYTDTNPSFFAGTSIEKAVSGYEPRR
jgi:predicted TIM-barrel fold metal-dependent hydrolase